MNDVAAWVLLGLSKGLIYGLLAMGLVLVYKGTRVLNLAHPFFGLLAAFIVWWLTDRAAFLPFEDGTRPRFLVALALGLALIGLNGFLLQRDMFRRLRNAPRLVTLVLTIALAQGLLGLVIILFERNREQAETLRIIPSIVRTSFVVGDFGVTGADVQVYVLVPLIALAGALFFKLTKFGVAVRAAAENGDAAQLLGISVNRVAAFSWIVGSVLAGLAGVLLATQQGSLTVNTLSIGFLVRALAAALIGGLTSLPGALLGGAFVGIAETILQIQWSDQPGLPESMLFVVVVLVLLVRPGGLFGQPEDTEDAVSFVPALRTLSRRLAASPYARTVNWLGGVTLLGFVIAMSMVTGSGTNGILVNVAVFATVGVSLTVLMGHAGQISLGHWALVGVGAFTVANLSGRGSVPYLLAIPVAVLVGMLVSLVIGLPALRIRGLYLAIVTLAFSFAAEFYIFRSQLIGAGQSGILVDRPEIGPLDLSDPSNRPLFFFAVAALLVSMWVARNLARSRTGRTFFALRENEKAAETMGVQLTRARLLAFTVSGGIAALAGAVFSLRLSNVNADQFPTQISLLLVAMVMIGGLGSLLGSALGALLVFGLPNLAQFDNEWIVPIGTGILLLIVIVRVRGGLAGLLETARQRFIGTLFDIDRFDERPPAPGLPGEPVPEEPVIDVTARETREPVASR